MLVRLCRHWEGLSQSFRDKARSLSEGGSTAHALGCFAAAYTSCAVGLKRVMAVSNLNARSGARPT